MLKLRLTSPGTLLIIATGLAGAILLVDAFILRPYVEGQKDAALREEAFGAIQKTERDLQQQELSLLGLCRAHAAGGAAEACLGRSGPSDSLSPSLAKTGPADAANVRFQSFADSRLRESQAGLAWLCDDAGQVRCLWSRCGADAGTEGDANGSIASQPAGEDQPAAAPPAPNAAPDAFSDQLAQALKGLPATPFAKSGLVRIGSRVALFAQADVGEPAGQASATGATATISSSRADGDGNGTRPLGTWHPGATPTAPDGAIDPAHRTPARLGLARFLEGSLLKSLAGPLEGQLLLVVDARLPREAQSNSAASPSFWTVSEDTLGVAWPVSDSAGAPLGYFRAEIPVGHIARQASAARQIILIILSLSVGLVSLIIMGTHILVAGPVVRLLRRLQQLDNGQGAVSTLTRDLHGEPLLLARRLESAFERLAQLSKTDTLTALANRTHFHEVLDAFYHQARRYNRPLSVIVLDVDYFKAVNDAGGHQAGDEVLKCVGTAIEKACRKADLPARMGGDEFAVLLPETPCQDAEHVAERIRLNIAAQPVLAGGLSLNLTASIGVADLNCGDIDGPQKMVVAADRALYAAKEAGRNRIVLAHDLEAPGAGPESRKVEVLYKKLAGLDGRFKDLFLHALEEVVSVMEQRDPHMADHARKVQYVAEIIAREMGLPQRVVQRLRVSAMMHDIGMLAIPDAVLLSDGPLDENQTRNLRRHPLLGVRIMERMEFLEHEIPAVRYHHERFDGLGYPEGLAGPAIPLTARILAVADSFTAMTSPRTFRGSKVLAEALEEIRKGAGKQFDPAVVEAFDAVAARLGEGIMLPPEEERAPSRWREGPREIEPSAAHGAHVVGARGEPAGE